MPVVTTDPKWVKPERYTAYEQFFLKFMKDERDMIFVRTATQITLTLYPLAILLFLSPHWLVGLLALPYLAYVFIGFGGRYGLMLHALGHRPMFKREYNFLDNYVPWALGFFLGHTPTSFKAHHMFMHHAEGNLLGDGSTTMPYQRDRFSHFLHYWARFFLLGYVHLTRYLWLRNKKKVAINFILGEMSWYALVATMMYINWAAALVVLVIPMLAMRWLMMAGNFAQHSFVDVDDADNPYRNSTHITNSPYNHRSYNDGYHIIHHLWPSMHWSEMALHYENNVEEFIAQDAIVFNGIRDNQHVWFLLMTHNYDKLASCLVDFKGRSHEEKIAFLQGRVRRQRGDMPRFLHLENLDDVERTSRKNKEAA